MCKAEIKKRLNLSQVQGSHIHLIDIPFAELVIQRENSLSILTLIYQPR